MAELDGVKVPTNATPTNFEGSPPQLADQSMAGTFCTPQRPSKPQGRKTRETTECLVADLSSNVRLGLRELWLLLVSWTPYNVPHRPTLGICLGLSRTQATSTPAWMAPCRR